MDNPSNYFTKLIHNGQFTVDENGHAILLGEYLVMIPPKAILELISILEEKVGVEETKYILYQMSQTQVIEAYKRYVSRFKINQLNKRDILDFSINTLNFLGWGNLVIKSVSFKDKTFEVVSKNTVLPIRYKEKYDKPSATPIDMYLMGILKKVFESLFETQLDVKEAECMAMGHPQCRFVGRLKV